MLSDYKFWIAVGLAWAFIKQNRKDTTGVAHAGRKEASRNERRWKHQLADEIEELEPADKSARLAKRLREDAWRD